MGSVQFSLFFKQAPVFRWGERMFHPPGWAGGKSDSHRPCSDPFDGFDRAVSIYSVFDEWILDLASSLERAKQSQFRYSIIRNK